MWINATAGRGRVRCRLPARVRRGGRNGKSAVWAFDCRLARANRLDWWMEECATAFAYQPASATRSVQLRWMCCWSLPLNHSHRAALGLAVASVRTGDLVAHDSATRRAAASYPGNESHSRLSGASKTRWRSAAVSVDVSRPKAHRLISSIGRSRGSYSRNFRGIYRIRSVKLNEDDVAVLLVEECIWLPDSALRLFEFDVGCLRHSLFGQCFGSFVRLPAAIGTTLGY